VFSVEATVALIDMAAKLMRALWLRARERHLDERLDQARRCAGRRAAAAHRGGVTFSGACADAGGRCA
jgi:hypothetical protein